ncbi:hypothetical protein FFLO_02903 [Filobasidium floriforme]|uniref:Uncharacterized protein n=1 Tax=Filobasidium floriforme TaxID=5210 RepID=A0A8K0JN62_9TREE|nr:hypothetical protein FFLO_02903 [Filobasidium floriforme]
MPRRERQEELGHFDRLHRPSFSTDLDLGTDADLEETFDRPHNHLNLDEHHNRNLDDHYDLNNHYLDEHYELDDHYGSPQHDHNDYDDDIHTYDRNHNHTQTHTHEHFHNHNHDHTHTSPILLPTPSPTLSEHTRRRLSYGDPYPQLDYSVFGMIDRILTPKIRTPDRLVMPSVDGEEDVLVLDRAFDESDSLSFPSPRTTRFGGTEVMDRMGMEIDLETIERRNRKDTPRSPGKPQPVTPDQSTSSTIRTGENGILLTPGDKEGMTGLGIVCRPRSGSGYFAPTPASSSIPEAGTGSLFGSAGSVARRRVLTFSREEQEDDTYNPIEPDNLVLKSSFQSRSPQHERYRTTSSAYALPAPVNRNRKKNNNGGNGRAYRQRMGKYPFNNPFARILFFSTVVILLAALFGVGAFVDDGADAGVAAYDSWMRGGTDMRMRGNGYGDGNQLRGWSGMVGDETQVFGLVGLPATPSRGMSGDVFYGEQPAQGHYQTSYSYLDGIDEEEEKSKGYKLHKRRVHQQKYKRNGWRAKVRRAGAALHSHAEE